jgi:hypothetical protein
MIGNHFYTKESAFDAKEVPSDKEVRSKEDLAVELPARNEDFHTLALALSKRLPRGPGLPTEKGAARQWQTQHRARLRELVKAKDYTAEAIQKGTEEKGGVKATYWQLRLGKDWTVPVVELVQGKPKATAILVNDAGRKADPVSAGRLLSEGYRVLAVDPFYFGEAKLEKDYLFALLVATVGERSLGIQASQLAAVARWSLKEHKNGPVKLVAVGPRSSTFALVAAALEEKAVGELELHGALGSLKEVIEQNRSVEQMPELFCFGLLEVFDVKHLTALTAPRPVRFVQPGERVRAELVGMKAWYALLGSDFEPLP